MSDIVQVRGQQYQQLVEALSDAFPTIPALTMMLMFRLAKPLANYAALPAPVPQVAFELIQNANAEGWTGDLIAAARESRPKNPRLLKLAQDFGLTAATAELERLVRDDLSMLDIAQWRSRLGEIEGQVCRIETPTEMGTGFLLGPDVLLTNYHVMEAVIRDPTLAGQVVCRFDFKQLANGTTLNPGTPFHLATNNWLLDSSPYSPTDQLAEPGTQTPALDQLDYALLRLDDEPGAQPIAGPKAEPGLLPRGWVPTPAVPFAFPKDAPLFIVQHPQARPLKLALDTKAVIAVNANATRVRYRTNTEPGSSGSPVFNEKWDLVALHHSGDRRIVPVFNQGVPLMAILKLLTDRGRRGLLGPKAV